MSLNRLIIFIIPFTPCPFAKRVIAASILVLLSLPLTTAAPFSINFDTEDGLPSMEVYDLEILDDEKIWFATDRGICIYDGYDFETLTKKDGLLHNCVLRLNKDPWGKIWMTGLDQKLCFYDGKSIQPYLWNAAIYNQIPPNAWITDLAWDEEGNLIFMYAVGLKHYTFRIDQQTGQLQAFDPAQNPANKTYSQANGDALVDVKGQLIPNFPISTCSGISPQRKWIYFVDQNAQSQLSQVGTEDATLHQVRDFSFRIFSVLYTSDGALCVGTNNGLYYFEDGDMNSVTEHAFPGIAISRVFEDKSGGFWLTTTEKGIFYLPSMSFHSQPDWDAILTKETVVTVQKGPRELFIATQEGNVYALDTNGNMQHLLATEKYGTSLETVNVGPTSVLIGPLRLVREKSGFRLEEQTVVGLVAASLELSDGTIFVAGYNGWAIRNAAEDTVLSRWSSKKMGRVQRLLEMPDKILIGASNGLFEVDKQSKSAKMVAVNGAPFSYRVSDIELDKWGNCWVSTFGNGLFCIRGTEVKQIGEQEGLRSTTVNRITFDDQGRLWIATNYGLARLEYLFANEKIEINGIKTLTSLNGLPSNYVRDVSFWQGKIYIASDQGLHYFAASLPDRVLPIPQIHLQRVLVNEVTVEMDSAIHLPAHIDDLEIHFSAYSAFKSKQQPLFRCRLVGTGMDSTWVYTNARSQHYRNLDHGDYRFELEACNARGEWAGHPTSLSIVLRQGWLKRQTIPLLLLAAAILILIGVWWRRKRKPESETEETDPNHSPPTSQPEGPHFDLEQRQLILLAAQGYKVVSLGQIRYVEANGSYVVLHLEEGKQHVLSQSLTAMEELLPEEFFFRTHKSFLLNCEVVEGYESGRGGKIFLRDGSHVPIAVRRKAAFIQKMKKKGLQ